MAKKKRTWLYLGVIILIGFAVFVNLLINFWFNPFIEKIIKRQISQATENKYDLDFEKITFNVFSNDLEVDALMLKGNPEKINLDSTNYYELTIDRLNINIGSIWNVIFAQKLLIELIVADNPEVRMVSSKKNSDSNTKNLYTSYSFFSGFLQDLNIQKTNFKNVSFALYKAREDTVPKFSLEKIDAYFDYLKIDSAKLKNKKFSRYADDFRIVVRDFVNLSTDSLYELKLGKVTIQKSDNSIRIDEFALVPQFERYTFSERVGHRVGRNEIEIPSIEMASVNFDKLLDDKKLEASLITAHNLKFLSFTDNRLELSSEKKKMLNQVLLDIPISFAIDTLKIIDGFVEHEQKTKFGDHTGHITFEDLYATVYHISNQQKYNAENTLEADCKTKFMGEGDLEVKFEIPVENEMAYHKVSGRLGKISLLAVNDIFEVAARTKVETGTVNYLDFSMELDSIKAEGTMQFSYNDLKIELLQSDLESPELMENVASWLANVFVLKESNPTNNNELREGQIYFERDKRKSVVSYWVNALLIGIRESVGIKSIPKRLGNKDVKKE